MERARGDEQDVVRAHHAIAGGDGAALDERQQVALHAFPGHIDAMRLGAAGDLVQLVQEDDAGLLHGVDGVRLDLVFVHQPHGFLFPQAAARVLHLEPHGLLAAAGHVGEHVLQLARHLLHAGRRHDLNADGGRFHLQLHLAVIHVAGGEPVAEKLPRFGAIALGGAFGGRQHGVQQASFRRFVRPRLHLLQLLVAQHLHGDVGEVADDGFHVAPHIAHFGELGGLHLDEGRPGEAREATGDFRLADAGGADHQDVLRRHLVAQRFGQLHAPPPIAQGDGHGAFRRVLPNDVLVQLADNLLGGHDAHAAVSASTVMWWLV